MAHFKMRHRLFSSFAQFYNNIIFKPNTAAQNPLFFLFDISAVYKKRFCRNRGMNNNIAGSTSLQNRTAPRQPLVFENPYAHTIGLSNSYSPGLKPDNRAVFLCNISFIFLSETFHSARFGLPSAHAKSCSFFVQSCAQTT